MDRRTAAVSGSVVELRVPARVGTVVDLAPVSGGAVLLLDEADRIWRWDLGAGDCGQLATTGVADESDREPWNDRVVRRRLHASADGAFAAVVNDYGRFGEVLDLRSGRVTMALDGGDDDAETVPFSVVFAERGGQVVVVHRTDSDRLDVSVAATGMSLTGRPPAGDDYYHGALRLSPDGTRLLDDGWVWHPVGIPSVRSFGPAESTAVMLCQRDDWDHAMTWIDSALVAVGGFGDDLVRIFDTTRISAPEPPQLPEAAEVGSFAGPAGEFFGDGGHLYSADDAGLRCWDPAGGALLGTVDEFVPTHHDQAGGRFLQLTGGTLLLWGGQG